MNKAHAVEALTHAVACAQSRHKLTAQREAEALGAIASAERLASAARHAANAFAMILHPREGQAAPDLTDLRTELLIAVELFERKPLPKP